MKVKCSNCGNNFEVERDNFECPMCGYNTRPDATNKVRISEIKIGGFFFWIIFLVVSYLILNTIGFFESMISFPCYGLLILLVAY
ncbi:MAG: hydrogenase maturation nickel metallochaperone HypA, partial [Bacilli bacterium]|nr:hydrogenase maturation nickel metallochaperone HypA [Bacilli bacterium]